MEGPAATSVALSVVVVAHDMARELPRTLRSLSRRYQLGLPADDYEVIVVDNGSADPSIPRSRTRSPAVCGSSASTRRRRRPRAPPTSGSASPRATWWG